MTSCSRTLHDSGFWTEVGHPRICAQHFSQNWMAGTKQKFREGRKTWSHWNRLVWRCCFFWIILFRESSCSFGARKIVVSDKLCWDVLGTVTISVSSVVENFSKCFLHNCQETSFQENVFQRRELRVGERGMWKILQEFAGMCGSFLARVGMCSCWPRKCTKNGCFLQQKVIWRPDHSKYDNRSYFSCASPLFAKPGCNTPEPATGLSRPRRHRPHKKGSDWGFGPCLSQKSYSWASSHLYLCHW